MRQPDISNLNGTVIRLPSAVRTVVVIARPHEQQHEPAAAGAQQFAADGSRLHRGVEQSIDRRVRHAIRQRALELPGVLQEIAELDEIRRRRRHDVDRLLDHLLHRPHVGRFVLHVRDDRFRDVIRRPGNAGEDEHEVTLKRVQPLGRQHDRRDAVGAVPRNRDVVEAAERRRHLILQPDALAEHALLDVDGFVGERLLRDVAPIERVHAR